MPFTLTKSHIKTSFAPLLSTTPADRAIFFNTVCRQNIKWTITGQHVLSGTRHDIPSHCDASFNRLLPKLTHPIKFNIVRIMLDEDVEEDGTRWACVETKGEAWTKLGEEYFNDYIWLTRWDEEGRIVEIRSYFDSAMAQYILDLEIPESIQDQ